MREQGGSQHEPRMGVKGMPRRRYLALAAMVLIALVWPSPVLAHAGGRTDSPWSLWHLDPLILLGLVLSGGLYARGLARLWRRGVGRGVRRWQAAAFAAGLAVLAFALLSPLAGLAEELFSAHMGQHLLLLLVAPPLLLLGAPHVPGSLALPRAWRRPLAAALHRVGRYPLCRALGSLGVVWLVQIASLWLWHLPALYEAALRHELLHALEHVTFIATALLFWSVVLAPFRSRRAEFGAAIVFVIATALPNGLLGALMTLAPRPWYPTYAASTAAWGLTPLVDQQLAGLLMWIPPGLVSVALVAGLLLAWLGGMEPRRRESDPPRAALRPISGD